MFVDVTVPKGVLIGGPPAKGRPPVRVWHGSQLARREIYGPRSIRIGSFAAAAGAMSAMFGESIPRSIQPASRRVRERVLGEGCNGRFTRLPIEQRGKPRVLGSAYPSISSPLGASLRRCAW